MARKTKRAALVLTTEHRTMLTLGLTAPDLPPVRERLRPSRETTSTDELKTRILKGVDEMNQLPVVLRWNKFDIGVA